MRASQAIQPRAVSPGAKNTGGDQASAADGADDADLRFHDRILPGVSRTFALTIPELPPGLRLAVANAYLLCRIADTIEDEVALSPAQKRSAHAAFVAAVAGDAPAQTFVERLHPLLSSRTLPAERELVARTVRILQVTAALPAPQRAALRRCVTVMCEGMSGFEHPGSLAGLAALDDLDRYCYVVAGVVGEMLTELFSGHSAAIAARRGELMCRAVAFGQGLQMTNILKDFWEDRARGRCWLPREAFAGIALEQIAPDRVPAGFEAGLARLIGIAHAHLRTALEYTLLIPAAEAGIRRFCLWSIGLAMLTLRNIHRRPRFERGADVKVRRATVRGVVLASSLAARQDTALRGLFGLAARGLPLARSTGTLHPAGAKRSS